MKNFEWFECVERWVRLCVVWAVTFSFVLLCMCQLYSCACPSCTLAFIPDRVYFFGVWFGVCFVCQRLCCLLEIWICVIVIWICVLLCLLCAGPRPGRQIKYTWRVFFFRLCTRAHIKNKQNCLRARVCVLLFIGTIMCLRSCVCVENLVHCTCAAIISTVNFSNTSFTQRSLAGSA